MEYEKNIILKDGRECIVRSCEATDAESVLENMRRTHAETDYLTSYPDENDHTKESEELFLDAILKSEREVELCAVTDGRIVGTAGVSTVGKREKVQHRAELGISVEKEYWHLGIGRALLEGCIECAIKAGYVQLELSVVTDNPAVVLYEHLGFTVCGRNPKGFRSRINGWQELLYMIKEL